jgi:putative oxidoreductase
MNFLMKVNSFCSKFKFVAQLLSRAIIGYVFIPSGLSKFHHLDKIVSFFKSLGIPLAELHAPLVASMEVGCGALIVIGLFTQLASIPLIVIMAMAIFTAKMGEVHDLHELFALSEFLYIALLLWLMAEGPGPISLGFPFTRKSKAKSKK